MDTSTPSYPGTPDPSEFDGGQPDPVDDETPDVLFPDTLGAHGREEPLPRADEADALEQQTDAVPDSAAGDAEDERRD
ncbi:hypothetical protein GCM10009740_11950 [Terrabacter terrae]|uniref:Uncharacterized protein n=1 Tax=Terrabacter terrae TaxID=318434 RepID=A0ABN2TXF8_9MICO